MCQCKGIFRVQWKTSNEIDMLKVNEFSPWKQFIQNILIDLRLTDRMEEHLLAGDLEVNFRVPLFM